MVEPPKRTGSPVARVPPRLLGQPRDLALRARRARAAPRAAARRSRSAAAPSASRERSLSSSCIASSSPFGAAGPSLAAPSSLERTLRRARSAPGRSHLLRVDSPPAETLAFGADRVVIGERNPSARSTCSAASPPKRSSSECREHRSHTGGMNRPRAPRQKRLSTNAALPPLPPPPQRAQPDPEMRVQLRHPAHRQPVLHRRHQHDDHAEIDPPARDNAPRAASLAAGSPPGAAEAQPPIVLRAEIRRAAARLARIARAVEPSAAPTPRRPRSRRELLIELRQRREEPGIRENRVPQRKPPFVLVGQRRRTLSGGLNQALRGVLRSFPSKKLVG